MPQDVKGVRARLRWMLAVLLMLCALHAQAMRRIDPGEDPKLAPDEGLVVLSVDTSAPIVTVHLARAEGGTATVLNELVPGRNTTLFAARAGDYQWAQMKLSDGYRYSRYDIRKPEFRFTVVPGRIVYPGDLIVSATTISDAYLQVYDNALPIMDWLQATHPALYARLPFEYSGDYPDPFPAYYRAALAAHSGPLPDLDAGREPPKPSALPIPAELMWKPGRVVAVAINPAGDLLAEALREDKGYYSLHVVDLRAGLSQRIGETLYPPERLRWKDDRTLLASTGSYTAYLIGERVGEQYKVRALPIVGVERVVDLLPAEPRTILAEGLNGDDMLVVHRVALEGDKSIRGFADAKTRDRLNRALSDDRGWLTDGTGRLRLAVVRRDDTMVVVHESGGVFHDVLDSDQDHSFEPLGLSFDGDTIYGLTDEDRPQRDLVAFDTATRKITRTVFSKPGVDITQAIFNDRREPIAALYQESGRVVAEYFDEANRRLQAWAANAFPGRQVTIIDRSANDQQLILWVESADHPGQVFHLDVATRRAELIEEMQPWFADRTFAPAHVIHAKGSDGLPIEAFLTLPPGAGKRPLVVYPHGGPIGVSDTLGFNSDVQFLASQRYAVLQVNFRGSEGYGRAFREAGYRSLGRGIEDDIDAAMQSALADYPLDASRTCVLGASYGGYSAMMAAIRWPDRIKCAVSIAGVSDRALFFSASDGMHSLKTRAETERLLGDPHADMAGMQAVSPDYHADALTVPLMLVHGRADGRVDFEHTRRMVRMLNLQGRPPC